MLALEVLPGPVLQLFPVPGPLHVLFPVQLFPLPGDVVQVLAPAPRHSFVVEQVFAAHVFGLVEEQEFGVGG